MARLCWIGEPLQHLDCRFGKKCRPYIFPTWRFLVCKRFVQMLIQFGGDHSRLLCQGPILRRWWARANGLRQLLCLNALVIPRSVSEAHKLSCNASPLLCWWKRGHRSRCLIVNILTSIAVGPLTWIHSHPSGVLQGEQGDTIKGHHSSSFNQLIRIWQLLLNYIFCISMLEE